MMSPRESRLHASGSVAGLVQYDMFVGCERERRLLLMAVQRAPPVLRPLSEHIEHRRRIRTRNWQEVDERSHVSPSVACGCALRAVPSTRRDAWASWRCFAAWSGEPSAGAAWQRLTRHT